MLKIHQHYNLQARHTNVMENVIASLFYLFIYVLLFHCQIPVNIIIVVYFLYPFQKKIR